MFDRTTPDPYRNSEPAITLFRAAGFTDYDRRWSDRGTLYASDLGDLFPGTTILKPTPTLGSHSPGPNSIMDGQWSSGDKCCGSGSGQQEDPEEDEVDCVTDAQNFLDSLPSPDEYAEWLLEQGPCSSLLMLLCNQYEVTVWHCPSVQCVWQNGWCFNCIPGDTGNICLCDTKWWCEKIVFSNYSAAKAFSDGTPECIRDGCAIVGESCVVHTAGPLGGDNDEFCQDNGCQILSDRTTPVAYTAGSNGDGSCGEDDNDGDGNADRQPAPEDNAWGAYIC